MSDTPIAERLTAELGSPWPLQWRITGWLYEDFEQVAPGSKVRNGGPDGAAPPGMGPHPLRPQ